MAQSTDDFVQLELPFTFSGTMPERQRKLLSLSDSEGSLAFARACASALTDAMLLGTGVTHLRYEDFFRKPEDPPCQS